jgi:hypothetical protein
MDHLLKSNVYCTFVDVLAAVNTIYPGCIAAVAVKI